MQLYFFSVFSFLSFFIFHISSGDKENMETVDKTFSFLHWNIGAAEDAWHQRIPKISRFINRLCPDIVVLVESYRTSGGVNRDYFLDETNYVPIIRKYGHSDRSLEICILVNINKFFIGDTRLRKYENTSSHDRIIVFVDLQLKETRQWITVGGTHFALDEDLKTMAAQELAELVAFQKYPVLLSGDFNFFYDRDGQEQEEILRNAMVDMTFPFSLPCGRELSGTFLGFPNDKFKKDFGSMSNLDRIYVSKGSKIEQTLKAFSPNLDDYKLDNSGSDPNFSEKYTYPSDHLAIFSIFKLP